MSQIISNNENLYSRGRMRRIKKVMLFSILVLSAGVVSALGTTTQNDCACNAPQEASSNGKLVDSQKIMNSFEQGQGRVKVIVNLAKPSQVLAGVDWKSTSSLKKLTGLTLHQKKLQPG